jgi:hypothetical protein
MLLYLLLDDVLHENVGAYESQVKVRPFRTLPRHGHQTA